MRKEMTYHPRVTLQVTDVTMSVTCQIPNTNDTISIYDKYLKPGHGNRDVSLC